MLNNIKDIILNNKYAILILFILSLWLRLARDCNVFLSYLILILLYIALGMVVKYVLARFFPAWADEAVSSNRKDNVSSSKHRDSFYDEDDDYDDEEDFDDNYSKADEHDEEYKREERKPVFSNVNYERVDIEGTRKVDRIKNVDAYSPTRSSSSIREVPRPKSYGEQNNRVYTKLERPQYEKTAPVLKKTNPEPRVPSSYVRNAGGIPYDMEKKLVRTSATFSSIKESSDHFANEERQKERVYNNSRKMIVDEKRDLYTNKKNVPDITNSKDNIVKTETLRAKEDIVSDVASSLSNYDADDYYNTSVDYEKESEDLKREVESRISGSNHSTRRTTRFTQYEDLSFGKTEPVRQQNIQIPRSTVTPTTKNINKNIVLGKHHEEKPISTRKVHVPTIDSGDKVDADIEKINLLFDKETDDYSAPKKGVFSRFKKKRR